MRSKLTFAKIDAIVKAALETEDMPRTEIARELGVSLDQINVVLRAYNITMKTNPNQFTCRGYEGRRQKNGYRRHERNCSATQPDV